MTEVDGRVLAVNVGSSSVRLTILDAQNTTIALRHETDIGGNDLDALLRDVLASEPDIDAVGHRVVHGGIGFTRPTIIDDAVLAELDTLADLAPLHNPPAVAAIRTVRTIAPHLPNVACFDTAFHRTIPDEAAIYAIPAAWTNDLGIRRFGFHGLNHSYAANRTAQLSDKPLDTLRIITCHLGAGASLCAVAHGRSIDTTMGFTPLEGLVMATRSGSLDPGALLYAQTRLGLSAQQARDTLEQRSGLLGLAGIADFDRIETSAADGDQRAQLALDIYLHRLRAGIASMAAALGGVDAITFTGGVGENSAAIRASTCGGLGFLGAELDDRNDVQSNDDRVISSGHSSVIVAVVHAREDIAIAEGTRAAVATQTLDAWSSSGAAGRSSTD